MQFPDLSKLNPQKFVDSLLKQPGVDQFLKGATYLPNDAPPPQGKPYVGLYMPDGSKIEVALDPASPLVQIVAQAAAQAL